MANYANTRFLQSFRNIVWQIRNSGIRVGIDELMNQTKTWNYRGSVIHTGNISSLSDGTAYVEICKAAVLEEKVFRRFKVAIQYREILEHTTFQQGAAYLQIIRNNIEVLNNIKAISSRDRVATFKYRYPGLGKISPSHIRYAKILEDLALLFGNLDGFSISEIGVGYGGQAAHILEKFNPNVYQLYDLHWVSSLAVKYIESLEFDKLTEIRIGNFELENQTDLLISNYAFSELNREIQEKYILNVVSNAKRGYMIYNHIQSAGSNALTA